MQSVGTVSLKVIQIFKHKSLAKLGRVNYEISPIHLETPCPMTGGKSFTELAESLLIETRKLYLRHP